MADDFKLLGALEDLDVLTHRLCGNFPKAERHVLSQEIRQTVSRMMHLVIRAVKEQSEEARLHRPPEKTLALVRECDVEIEYMKFQIRKAYTLNLVAGSAYEEWSRAILSVGGLNGGWIKTIRSNVEKLRTGRKQQALF